VRLSTRSPKDAVDKFPERLAPFLLQELSRLDAASNGNSLTDNEKIVALHRAFSQVLRVESAEEVFKLMAYSERTVSDLIRAVDYSSNLPWNLKFIIREFVEIPIEGEFRGFVSGGRLTALSQYFQDCFFPSLPPLKTIIAESIQHYFQQKVKDAIPYDSYVVDFAFFPESREVMIIEMNPFSPATGGGLFDWNQDKDVLENGPFELRILERENPNRRISPEWNALCMPQLEAIRARKSSSSFWKIVVMVLIVALFLSPMLPVCYGWV